MKLNEIVSARYGCKFPARYNKSAVEYYKENVFEKWPSCIFILDMMQSLNDYTVHQDELKYMCEHAPDVWPALLESFLYAAYEDVKKNGRKPRNLAILLDEEG